MAKRKKTKVDDQEMYFASPQRTPDDVAADVLDRVEGERNRRERLLRRWHRNYCYYHNYYFNNQGLQDLNDSNIFFVGEQGETLAFSVNQFHNLIEHMHNIITGTRPAYSCVAMNSDVKSRNQARIANDLLEYCLYHYNLEDKFKRAVKYALLFDCGYLKVHWDSTKGEVIIPADPDTGVQEIREGEPDFQVIHPKDVFYDDNTPYFYDNQWVAVRWYRNKWDLVATFPDKKDDILSEENANEDYYSSNGNTDYQVEQDNIAVYEFFHKPTPSVPDGRYMLMTTDGTVLLDHELSLDFIPMFQITAGDDLMHQNGYTPVNDLAAIQQILNAQYSAIASNHENLGMPVILVPADSNVTVEQLEGSYNLVKYEGEQAPGTLKLLQDAPEMFNFIQLLEKTMETLSGVNAVSRGNLQSHNIPGVSIALMNQQTLEFMNHLQQSYTRFVEMVGLAIVKLYQQFATTERVIQIAGKKRVSQVTSFKGTDIADVNSVEVSFGNPLARTLSGRLMLAEYVAKIPNLVLNFSDILTVLETGDLSALTDAEEKSAELSEKENEIMMEGRIPRVLPTDDHRQHIIRHTALLDDPSFREDGNPVFDAVNEHIAMHIQMINNPNVQQLHSLLGHATGVLAPSGMQGQPPQRSGAATPNAPEAVQPVSGPPGINVRQPKTPGPQMAGQGQRSMPLPGQMQGRPPV